MTIHPASTSPLDTSSTNPSPKRKRSLSGSIIAADSIFAPDINVGPAPHNQDELPELQVTTQLLEEGTLLPGTGSPRTAVATKFQNLALRGVPAQLPAPAVRFGGEAEADGGRGVGAKRVKMDTTEGEAHSDMPPNVQTKQQPRPSSSPTPSPHEPDIEVPETPQTSQESPPPSSSHDPSSHAQTHPKIKSPPPPANTTISKIDVAALTWQDSEITGHLALDPDDDGYGINGIGFKPTAQQVYARAQRRRQQVLEWRSREAREARQRRAEGRKVGGRRGVPGGADLGGAKSKERVVRFAS